MNNNEKVLVNKQCINKIIAVLSSINATSKEKNIRRLAEKLLKDIQEEISMNKLSLKDKILKKMKETKTTDPDMNANLYILYRKLTNKQITEEQAQELFEMYVKIEPYDTKIY